MALTTLAKVQALPGAVSTWEAADITIAINAATAMIEHYCDRVFDSTARKTWLDGPGSKYFRLLEYPLITLRRVAIDTEWALKINNTSADAVFFEITVAEGSLNLTVTNGANAGTSILTLSSYSTMALLETAIEALNKGWSVTVESEGDPASIRPVYDGTDSTSGYLYLSHPYDYCTGYIPDARQGLLYRPAGWPSGAGRIYVDYTAGYATIPADLEMVANQLTCDLLRVGAADTRLTALKVGNVAYTYSQSAASLIENYKVALMPYKRVAL